MSAIDKFMAEMPAAGLGKEPEFADLLESALRTFETGDSPLHIAFYDRITEIVRRRLPLLDRVEMVQALMQQELP
jgi:hypothetical protein